MPNNLQMVHIPTITEKDCDDAYQPAYVITSRMMCAGLPDGGKDACQVILHGCTCAEIATFCRIPI